MAIDWRRTMSETDPTQATSVELRTTRFTDISLGVAGSVLGPLLILAAFALVLWPDPPIDAHDTQPAQNPIVLALTAITTGVAGFWLLCTGIGGIWRLVDRRPALVADSDGLHFHPSLCGRSIAWAQIRSVRSMWVGRYTYPQIKIELTQRFWSPHAWITSTSVRLNLAGLEQVRRDVRAIVRELKSVSQGRFVPRVQSEPNSTQPQRRSKNRKA
jgi:hypothetical protein